MDDLNDNIRRDLASYARARYPYDEEDNDMPRAYGNCQCACHRQPGIMHVMACCHPGDDKKYEDSLVEMRRKQSVANDLRYFADKLEIATKFNEQVNIDRYTKIIKLLTEHEAEFHTKRKECLDELTKQAQELDMGYGENKK